MTDHATGTGLRRVDERLGLALARASLSGRTLVTYARDHVSVRTPSRPDFHAGNTIDLLHVPAPDELVGWVHRFEQTVGRLGAQRVQVRFEEPLEREATDATAGMLPDELTDAASALGLRASATSALLLGTLQPVPAVPATFVPVAPPSLEPGAPEERQWHAATVLYRYESGDHPDAWRDVDQAFVDWSVDVQRELARAGRAQVWIAVRQGVPVARLTVVHDRQGLASVEDVITHPAHRRRGLAAALTATAVAAHLDVHPGARVGLEAEPGSSAERLYRRLGFLPHARIWTLRSD